MKENMLLKKICSIYASDIHFATMIFPFIHQELEKQAIVRTILEKDEQRNIEKVLENVGLNSEIKEEVRKIDWKNTTIDKIRENFNLLEKDIKNNKQVDIIVAGRNIFIQKVNKAIDLWVKNHLDLLEQHHQCFNIINCFSLEENKQIEPIMDRHDYLLKTAGLEEIEGKEELLKAN